MLRRAIVRLDTIVVKAERRGRQREWAYDAVMSTAPDRKAQAKEVIRRLRGEYRDAGIVLDFGSDWELLVAVILSAQCTDKMVNQVTADLFKKYRGVEDYAAADPAEFEMDIRPTGFFRNKTKHIIGAAQKILADYGGEVPASMQELLTLPGVARKTANIVLGNAHPERVRHRPRRGDRRGHPRQPAQPEAGACRVDRLGEDRAGVDGDRASGRLVPVDLPADRARPGRLHGQAGAL